MTPALTKLALCGVWSSLYHRLPCVQWRFLLAVLRPPNSRVADNFSRQKNAVAPNLSLAARCDGQSSWCGARLGSGWSPHTPSMTWSWPPPPTWRCPQEGSGWEAFGSPSAPPWNTPRERSKRRRWRLRASFSEPDGSSSAASSENRCTGTCGRERAELKEDGRGSCEATAAREIPGACVLRCSTVMACLYFGCRHLHACQQRTPRK